MIYSPETKQNKAVRYLNMVSRSTITIYIQMAVIHCDYVLCARCVSFVTLDSSSSLHDCSMGVLPSPLLLINCFSCSPFGGRALPNSPHPGWPYFSQGPGTFLLLRQLQWSTVTCKEVGRSNYYHNIHESKNIIFVQNFSASILEVGFQRPIDAIDFRGICGTNFSH